MARTSAALAVLLFVTTVIAGCIGDDAPTDDTEVTDPDGGRWSRVAPGTYSVIPGDYVRGTYGSVPLVPGTLASLAVERVVLTSDLDGVDIDLALWRPDVPADEPVPVIIQASPYFPRTDAPSGSQDFGLWMVDTFVPRGYAYVQLAIRSTADSGGCDDFRGPDMVADMDQAIDWLAGQEWSNGHVALIGKSYPGSTPWYAAGAGNPAIKTIVPVSGSTNAWEVYNRNGTPEVRAAIIVPNYGVGAATNDERDPEHKVENFTCTDVWEGWAYGVSSGVTGERLPPEWWEARNAKPAVEANYAGSVLLVHGLEDWNVDPAVAIPWTQRLADQGVEVKQLLGQWGHDHPDHGDPMADDTPTIRWDWAEILVNWFDHYLKDDPEAHLGPPVQVQANDGRWRDELAWPPKDAEARRLHVDGAAFNDEPGTAGSVTLTTADVVGLDPLGGTPAPAGSVHDVVLPVTEDLHIAGLPKVHVTVTPTGPSGYIGAHLLDRAPDGSEKRIGWTGMNLRFADGTETPKAVVPGAPLLAKLQIQPMDAVVPVGHELVLRLGAVLPEDRIPPPHPAPVTLHWGAGAPSVLELPLVERAEEAFFAPPMPPASGDAGAETA